MIIHSNKVRFSLVLLLVVGHAYAIAHAAEHSIGHHGHECQQCVYGAQNDDNSDAMLESAPDAVIRSHRDQPDCSTVDHDPLVVDFVLPPPTGPPTAD
ncbi:MAG: hypothetical protein AAF465_00035 [Pseudomonadota bacterium]